MSYLNANDLPEHARTAFESAVMNKCTSNVTTNYGPAVVLSKDVYEQLKANAAGEYYCEYSYKKHGVDRELERYLREEVDF